MVAGLVAKQILRDDEVLFDGKIFKPLLGGSAGDKFYLSERDHWATAKRDGGGYNASRHGRGQRQSLHQETLQRTRQR